MSRDILGNSSQTNRNGIFVIDDEAIVRDWFRTTLMAEPDLCLLGEAARGADNLGATLKALSPGPDLVILDLALPGKTGLELIDDIRAAVPGTKILIYSRYRDPGFLRKCRGRIEGYLLKSEPVDLLVAVIRDLLRGKEYFSPLIHRLHQSETSEYSGGVFLHKLSRGEREVLRGVFAGMSAAQIAAELEKSPRTVEVQIGRAYKKLNVRGKTEFLKLISASGLEL